MVTFVLARSETAECRPAAWAPLVETSGRAAARKSAIRAATIRVWRIGNVLSCPRVSRLNLNLRTPPANQRAPALDSASVSLGWLGDGPAPRARARVRGVRDVGALPALLAP